jgi:carbon monoxide dehydrogenase subunit G
MRIEDSFRVAAPVDRVWRFITDPAEVGPCLPGCQNVEVTEPNKYRATIRVAVGPIKTTFNVLVELTEQDPPHRAASVTRGEEGGKASTLTAQSELRLAALDDGGTEVHYASEVALVGRLGKFGLGIMKKKAKSLGEEFAAAFRARVEGAQNGGAIPEAARG